MTTYTLTITLKSPALIGSGEGFGAGIDSDVVFDDIGIPYIPAKRIKGCLRDAAVDVKAMFELSGISYPLQLDTTFGLRGSRRSAPVYFSNLTIHAYEANYDWLRYLLNVKEHGKKLYRDLLSSESILDAFTEIRQQTAIDPDGVAQDHALRTIRVVKADTCFSGVIQVQGDGEGIRETLQLACLQLRNFGTKRTRGFGEISCSLTGEQGAKLPVPAVFKEGVCTQ